jgi:phosphatidylserine decarboxylase
MTDLPIGYNNPTGSRSNPWSSEYLTPSMPDQPNPGLLLITLGNYFYDWCTFLPGIKGDQDDGLKFIQGFAWFYFHNPAAQQFVQGINPVTGDPNAVMNRFLLGFSNERGTYMDTLASTTKVPEWVADARIEIEDYQIQKASGYKSWNQFFSRQIIIDTAWKTIPSRPVTMPERDYVVVSPTDCIMNPLVQVLANTTPNSPMSRHLIENPLQLDTVIDVKNYPMSIDKLLANTPPNIKNAEYLSSLSFTR